MKEQITMRQRLADIQFIVNWAEMSEEYFSRTRHWIYQKMGGNIVNGKPAEFSEEEKQQLKNALYDVARRITEAADKI